MAMVSPALEAFAESLSTLKFAHRAKCVRNLPVVNEDLDHRTLLRRCVCVGGGGGGAPPRRRVVWRRHVMPPCVVPPCEAWRGRAECSCSLHALHSGHVTLPHVVPPLTHSKNKPCEPPQIRARAAALASRATAKEPRPRGQAAGVAGAPLRLRLPGRYPQSTMSAWMQATMRALQGACPPAHSHPGLPLARPPNPLAQPRLRRHGGARRPTRWLPSPRWSASRRRSCATRRPWQSCR